MSSASHVQTSAEVAVARGLEIHKPFLETNGATYCKTCFTDEGYDGAFPVLWPCPTAVALESASVMPPTTEAELEALPIGSTVHAHWEDGSQADHHMMRCRDGGASSSGFGVASGKYWTNMANWGATLTVLGRGKA